MHKRWPNAAMLATATAMIATAVAGPAAAAAPSGDIRMADSATAVAGSYVVVLRESPALQTNGIATTAQRLAAENHGTVRHVYTAALHGFAARMSDADARRLATDPAVDYVQQDQTVSIDGTQVDPPAWGIDRIDQRNLPLDETYVYPTTASRVHAYVIDTGVLTTHTTFGGRATSGIDTHDGDNDATDCNGHGAHVSGTIGGREYGVAKGIQIVGVKVLDCGGFGSSTDTIAGIDWVTANAIRPAVANMSLRFTPETALDSAVQNSIASGVVYAVSAGNASSSACGQSPARVPEAITVGATTITDRRAGFSNYGTCVDLFAPGEGILSSYIGSDTATAVLSGTSMASPHAAGAAALVLSVKPTATAAQVTTFLVNRATVGLIPNPGPSSPNKLLYVGH